MVDSSRGWLDAAPDPETDDEDDTSDIEMESVEAVEGPMGCFLGGLAAAVVAAAVVEMQVCRAASEGPKLSCILCRDAVMMV
jgi:hypothetical protein